MTRRYLALLAGVVILGLALGYVARSGGLRPHAPRAVAAAPAPRAVISLHVIGDQIDPPKGTVPLGARVALRVVNEGRAPVQVALSGYGGRLPAIDLAPGAAWEGAFTADLPGEDFAWLVDGRPVGRLTVAGSHLVEGHR